MTAARSPSENDRLLLKGKRVVVFGLGKSGMAAAKLLLSEGAQVTALDQRSLAELGDAVAPLQGKATLALGPTPPDLLTSAELVVTSPGVPWALPELERARQAKVPVWGEIELGWRVLNRSSMDLVGITGTNGKSTTTALCGEMFKKAGRRVFVGGNLGRPLCDALLEGTPLDSCVLELSSFQLESIDRLRVTAAAILNLTPDHLDRYSNSEAYGQAKARIFSNQRAARGAGDSTDVAVVNLDDPAVMGLSKQAHVPLYGFTLGEAPRTRRARKGSYPRASLAGCAFPVSGGFQVDYVDATFSMANRALRGSHNVQNGMAAALLALESGVPPERVQDALNSYPGLPHRLESVRVVGDVEWINDSKATNVDSVLVALKAFTRGVWLIAGGRGKGAPYAPMVEASIGRVKGVLTLGEDAPAIETAYAGRLTVHPCKTLEGAVARAKELAVAGDVVLLSPACASYDQFKNFEHRGDVFKRLVRGLS